METSLFFMLMMGDGTALAADFYADLERWMAIGGAGRKLETDLDVSRLPSAEAGAPIPRGANGLCH